MKKKRVNGKWILVAILLLLVIPVLAGTVYAVTVNSADIAPLGANIAATGIGEGEVNASFKYEKDTTSEMPFNPIVTLSGTFTGTYAGQSSVSATDGADVETYTYSSSNQYLNFVIGGNTQFNSAFYQYNLIYTIKSYDGSTELAKFRVYRDQIYPIDCSSETLNQYLAVEACTFESLDNGVCGRATLKFKVPDVGIRLCYQSERLYVPVKVKQFVKNLGDSDYHEADKRFTSTVTKYFADDINISDFAQNKYFAADSSLTTSYGLNSAESSAFTDSYSVKGASESHFMLIENMEQKYQGFYIQPNAPAGYKLADSPVAIASYSKTGTQNTWDGWMSINGPVYVEGQGYCYSYKGETYLSVHGESLSHMGGQSVEVSVYYVQQTHEESGYTRSIKINGFTDNGLQGGNNFYLKGANGETMSYYYDNGASSGVFDSSKKDFDITVDNSFYVDSSCDTIRIVEPHHGVWHTKYDGVTVTADNIDVTSSNDITINYHSNLDDNSATETFVEISGLNAVTGDIEISGCWYKLDSRMYYSSTVLNSSVDLYDTVRISVEGRNNHSLVNDRPSHSWTNIEGQTVWLAYGGDFNLTANSLNTDEYELVRMEFVDTDSAGTERKFTYTPNSEGVVTFSTPAPDVKKETQQHIYLYFNAKENIREKYSRSFKIKGFTQNGLIGANNFYLSGADGAAMSFLYQTDADTIHQTSSYNTSFNINSDYSFYIEPSCDVVRIAEPRHGTYPTKYYDVTVTADGEDVTGLLIKDHSNFKDHAHQTDTYVEISGLKDLEGDIEVTGYWYPLDSHAYFSAVGTDSMNVSVRGQNDYNMVNDRYSDSWLNTGTKQNWLVYGGSYYITSTAVDDHYKLDKIVFTDTDFDNNERNYTFYPDDSGVVLLEMPEPDVKPGTNQYVRFYFVEKNAAELAGYTHKVNVNLTNTGDIAFVGGVLKFPNNGDTVDYYYNDTLYTRCPEFRVTNSNDFYLKPDQDALYLAYTWGGDTNVGYELTFTDDYGNAIEGITTETVTSYNSNGQYRENVIIRGLSNVPGKVNIKGYLKVYYSRTLFGTDANAFSQGTFTVTADDATGRINGIDTYTFSSTLRTPVAYLLYGESYTASFDGDYQRLKKANITYTDYKDGVQKTIEFPVSADGKIHFDLPKTSYECGTSGFFIQFEMEDIVKSYETQVFFGYGDYGVNGRGQVRLSAADDNGEAATNIMRSVMSYYSTGVPETSVYYTEQMSSLTMDETNSNYNLGHEGSFNRYYHILSGTKITVDDVYNSYANAGDDDDWAVFAASHWELTDIKVYKVEKFNHPLCTGGGGNWDANDLDYLKTNGVREEVEVTKLSDTSYSFIMPDCPIRIQPIYKNHIRTVIPLSNDNRVLWGENSTLGTATLSGDTDEGKSYFTGYYKAAEGQTSVWAWGTDSSTSTEWSRDYSYTLDGSTFNLTAKPNDPVYYYVSRVQIIDVGDVRRFGPDLNEISPTWWIVSGAAYEDWRDASLTVLNSSGNLNAGCTVVTDQFDISQIGEPDPETGETNFRIAFPDDLDFGNVIIMVYFEQKPSAYAHFEYQPDSSQGAYNPDAVIKGQLRNNITGMKTVNGNTDVESAIYDENSPIYTTVELGGSGDNSFFHETNLIYTLSDYTNDTELLQFRIYRGQILPVGDYTNEDLARYIYTDGSLVEKFGTDYGRLKERAILKFMLPQDGLRLTYTAEPTYIPVTVKQYVLDSNGNSSAVGNTFTADVYKNTTGTGGRYENKYFTADNLHTSSFGLSIAEEEAFTDSYTTVSANDTHYMYYDNATGGLYVYPNPESGYTVAAIRARAKNSSNQYVAADFNQSLTEIPSVHHNDMGYAITYQRAARRYLQSAALEIEVYYQPKTTLTVKQHIDGELESGTLATVTVNNVNTSAPVSPYSAFINDEDKRFCDSIELVDTRNNVIEYDESIPGALSRTTKLTVNKGVQPQIIIDPDGARNISSVKITKKNGSRYEAVPDTDYTVSGSLAVDGAVTYTFNNNINIGDDYIVDIVYGTEKTLTVKAVIIDSEGEENDVDTVEEFEECMATVTINAQRYDADGSNIDEYAFIDKTVEPNEEKNGFIVTYNPTTVTTATNTRVTVNTQIGEGSQYVIANVKALKDNGDDLHLAVPSTVVYSGSEVGPTYENCTLSSLASTDNVTIVVYLAKVVSFDVSVYTIGATREINNGVPSDSDAYVNVNVREGGVNEKAIITDQSEGGYYTGSFDITSNPHSRHVSVIQGTKLNVFAQLPGNGEYVIRKITANGSGYGDVTLSGVSFVNGDLREMLSTGDEAVSADKTYDIRIYIEKAQSIYTHVVDVNGDAVSAATGDVTVNGSLSEAGAIPLTKISPPAGYYQSTNSYDAVYRGAGYTTEAKCVRDTEVTFDVKPKSHYNIKSVTVKKGADKANATNVGVTLLGTAADGTAVYRIIETMPYSSNLYIDVEFEPDPDLINVYNTVYGYGCSSVKEYLFYVDDPNDIDFTANDSLYDELDSVNRFGAEMKERTFAYYVLSTSFTKEQLKILSARYSDVSAEDEGTDILSDLLSSYTTRRTSDGLRYVYYCRVNPSEEHPIDNDMWFTVLVNQYVYPSHGGNPDCSITVEQWNRETYDGQYVAADNQSARFSVPNGSVLRKNNKVGVDANPIIISSSMGYMYSEKETDLYITPLPAEGYNVEKVVIYRNGESREIGSYNGVYTWNLDYDPITVKIYYSRPMLIISSTNEGNKGKATVDVNNESVLNQNTFISGVFVTKNEDSSVVINPLTYDDNGTQKYYKVASIRIGNAFNNTLTAYTDAGGDVENDGYTVVKNADGTEYTLTLSNVQTDKYIFIQLVGKEKIYQSNVQLNQKIKLIGSNDYVDCDEGYYGSVTLNGTLAGSANPLNFGEDVSSYTLSNSSSAIGMVLHNTLLSLQATAPSGYVVRSVEAQMNGEDVTVFKNGDTYSIANKAPDSGTTVITVNYAVDVTPYTLVYNYQGRRGGNDGSFIGDDDEYDQKSYSVSVELSAADLSEGVPSARVLIENAPAVDDLYKDCVWTINDDHVVYDNENNTVTVTAVQTAKKCNVEFVYDDSTLEVDQVPINSLVQPDDEFVEAPASDGSNPFAYWSVVQNGSEIARCYDREFDLRITGDCTVTACYTADAQKLFISDADYSREQTTDANGKTVDKLYADFILAYMEKNGKLLNPAYDDHTDDNYQTGLIVEYDRNITLEKADEAGAVLSEQEKVVYPEGDKLSDSDAKTLVGGGALSDAAHSYLAFSVANSAYNNHNRVDRAISFINSETARHLVLRAYYYVWNKTTDEFEITDPVYFYLYDIGNSVGSAQ